MLVTSLKAYEQYQQKSAWLWEHQALVRARSIAGDVIYVSYLSRFVVRF
jgi:glutamate-ammonia-ligase adenylyltransferase